MRYALLPAAALLLTSAAFARDPGAPPTQIKPATDTYFNTAVTDPYRWLENTSDPAVHAWSVAQDTRTRAWFDHIPLRQQIHARIANLVAATSPSYHDLTPVAGRLFATIVQPPRQQPFIGVMGLDTNPANIRVVVDPNAINPAGTTAIDWWVPSPDGTKIAVSLSQNGSEDGTLHVFDTATGHETGDIIPRVQYPTGGGSAAWRADSAGFYYTRYPGQERPEADRHFYQQVYFHTLGAPLSADAFVLGRDFPKLAEVVVSSRQNTKYVLVTVANGDGGEFEHFVIPPGGAPRQVTHFADQVAGAAIGPDDRLYLTSRQGAPRGKLLRVDAADPVLAKATTLVPQSDAVIRTEAVGDPVIITPDALYIRELVGGPSRLAAYALDGKRLADVPVPPVAAVDEAVALPDHALLYQVATYLRPPYFLRYDEHSRAATATKLAQTSPSHFDDATVTRGFATSKDGTRVPVNTIAPKARC